MPLSAPMPLLLLPKGTSILKLLLLVSVVPNSSDPLLLERDTMLLTPIQNMLVQFLAK